MIQDPALEKSVLGSFFMNPTAFDEATDLSISADDFSLDSNRRIFRTYGGLMDSVGQADEAAVIHTLKAAGQLDSVGGLGYLIDLSNGAVERGSIKYHVHRLQELARHRRVRDACNSAISRENEESATVINDLIGDLHMISAGSEDLQADSVMRASEAAVAEWEADKSRDSELIGLPTGIQFLDLFTAGIRKGEYWIFGAWSGDGKSALACQIVRANCLANNRVHFFSLEMSKREIFERQWAAQSGIPFETINAAAKTVDVRGPAAEVSQWPWLLTDKKLTVERIVARAKASIRRFKTALIVVDFLQNIPHNERDPRLGINRVSSALRELAHSSGVPVVAFSQLRRASGDIHATNGKRRPCMFDLRESGQLEQDAHLVGLIHRPVTEDNKPTNQDLLIIAKNRHGRTGDVTIRFNPASMAFDARQVRSSARSESYERSHLYQSVANEHDEQGKGIQERGSVAEENPPV